MIADNPWIVDAVIVTAIILAHIIVPIGFLIVGARILLGIKERYTSTD